MLRTIILALALLLAAPLAAAHDHEGTVEATVIEVNHEERKITVLFEDGATESYAVAEDAEIFTFDGVLERPQDFAALTAGTMVELEFGDPEAEGGGELRSIRARGEER